MNAFWKEKPLDALTAAEWESLCDGCGRCCLHKLEDIDTGQVHYTAVACRLLDIETCRCRDYGNRHRQVPECMHLGPQWATSLAWLPATCAYRRVAMGEDLPSWHPLVSGSHDTVHESGVSVRHFAVTEEEADDLEEWLVEL